MSPKNRERVHPESRLVLALGCLLSGLAHSAACAALSRDRPRAEPPPPSRVEFHVLAAQPAPPPPSTNAPPEPSRAPAPSRASAPRSAPPPPRSEPAARAAESVETVDLSGVTLTADSGQGSFATLAGNGTRFDGPLGPAGPTHARPAPTAPSAAPAAAEPPLLALADLSARPVAPELGARLLDFYPAEAKRRGIAGTAQVRARIDADGRVRSVTPLGESFAGFAAACRRTLLGSLWSAPRDLGGRAVATEIRYTCRFVVEP